MSIAKSYALAKNYADEIAANALERGAVGDGVTDDTAAIQSLIDYVAERGGGDVLLKKGTYLITSALNMKDNVTLRGVGESTVLIQDVNASAGHSFIQINGRKNVTVKDMKLDGKVSEKATVTSASSGVHITNGSTKCKVENLIITDLGNHGVEGGGNHITVSAVQDGSDTYDNIVQDCVLIDPNGQSKFGIRLFTEWTLNIEVDEYTAFVRDNLIKNNKLIGFAWNAIEVAGPATIRNKIESNTSIDHVGFSAIEADKGASYNTYTNNYVFNVLNPHGRSFNQYGYRDQGSPGLGAYPDRYAHGNIWTNNFFDGMVADPTMTGGAMILSRSVDCVIQGLNVRNIEAPPDQFNSAGLVLDDVTNLSMVGGSFKDINTGIYAINDVHGITVSGGTVFQVRERAFDVAGGTGTVTEEVTFANCRFLGGRTAVVLQTGDGHSFIGNVVKDTTATSVNIYAGATANVESNTFYKESGDTVRFWADNSHIAVGNRIIGGGRFRALGETNTLLANNVGTVSIS